VHHLYSRSLCEVLIRLLNVSENVLEDSNIKIDEIREKYVTKVIEKF